MDDGDGLVPEICATRESFYAPSPGMREREREREGRGASGAVRFDALSAVFGTLLSPLSRPLGRQRSAIPHPLNSTRRAAGTASLAVGLTQPWSPSPALEDGAPPFDAEEEVGSQKSSTTLRRRRRWWCFYLVLPPPPPLVQIGSPSASLPLFCLPPSSWDGAAILVNQR